MRRIDADALMKRLKEDPLYPLVKRFNIDGFINAEPTVDAVLVVRCEDCRFWSKYPGSSAAPQYHECMARMTHIGNLYTTAWEYCSRGERKDGDNE